MTGFVLISFSGRVLVVQEVLRTVIIAPYRKAIGQSYQKITMDLVGEIKSE
jgi:hypothetical protein